MDACMELLNPITELASPLLLGSPVNDELITGRSQKRGGRAMNKMMKRAAVALVLAMVAFGPTAAIAAPHSNPYLSSASGAKFGIIDVLMQILGIWSRT